ncbi:complement C1q-like protein 2 [Clupea harengus]|uniref:Complement C1q-like protein 2 n=1 Tax=Clupea harengus TaxID=7950 RepID=A0A6P8H0L1_CLUHA|nr:complement C1q-like protein 2 [Clupea harengus]
MAHTTPLLLALLGCLCLGLASGQRGDSDLTVELTELRVLVKDMEAKLNDSSTKDGDLKALETRLNATEQQLEKLQSEVQRLGKENQDIMEKLNATVEELDQIKKQNGTTKGPKVAFSASLAPSGEVYEKHSDTSPNLVYKRIFTNTGNAYDSNTGSFTAPVKGIYFFSFSTFGYHNFLSGAILTKNGQYMVSSYDPPATGDTGDTGGNSVILQLEAGEKVTMRLWKNSQVFDNLNGHNTFSGFLLFPL